MIDALRHESSFTTKVQVIVKIRIEFSTEVRLKFRNDLTIINADTLRNCDNIGADRGVVSAKTRKKYKC